jgi:hypothetical protein
MVRAISSGRDAGERWRTWPAGHPQAGRLGGEHVVGRGVDDEPAAGVELAVELPLRPTRVPGEHPQVLDVDGKTDRVTSEVDRPEGTE